MPLPAHTILPLHDRRATLSLVGSLLAHLAFVVALVLATSRAADTDDRFGTVAVGGMGAEDTLFFLVTGGSTPGDPGDPGLPSLLPAAAPEESAPPLTEPDETAVPQMIEEPTGELAEGEGVEGGLPDSTGLAAAGGDGGADGAGGLGGQGTGTGFGIGPGGGTGAGSPRPLHLVVPRIPRGVSPSRARGESVALLLAVLPDGSVGETRIERASRIPALNTAALEAARLMRYVPARTDDLRWARAEMRF